MPSSPIIGITVDNKDNDRASGLYEVRIGYSQRVHDAGGLPVFLPHVVARATEYAELCDGLILTGGADPVMERFGEVTSSDARKMDSTRMNFELALLEFADTRPALPVLAVCLGMQLMALHRGGKLDQSLLRSQGSSVAACHVGDQTHEIEVLAKDSVLHRAAEKSEPCQVVSHHRQALKNTGSLRVVARAPDGVIEAIDDPNRPYYLGVQWHPERNEAERMSAYNEDLITDFVEMCASQKRRVQPS